MTIIMKFIENFQRQRRKMGLTSDSLAKWDEFVRINNLLMQNLQNKIEQSC